jgi:transmembrane sensor
MAENQLPERIEALAHKYRSGTLTEAEQAEFDTWYAAHQDGEFFHSQAEEPEALKKRLFQPLGNAMRKSRRQLVIVRMSIAASILLIISISTVIIYPHRQKEAIIVPGHQGATLTLSNGKKIHLTATGNGELAKEAGVAISKTANGQLVYQVTGNTDNTVNAKANTTNTLSTINGETYQVSLPDGSQVWLNAASSITYSANFEGQQNREIALTGEAYFEVAKDPNHAFIVHTPNQDITVLGTHFNISSYADDPAPVTTLLQGSIKVSDKILKPGEQATYINNQLLISDANTEEAVAWKNGYFRFNGEKLTSVMRKLARWYNIDVEFNGPVPDEEFSGTLSRSTNINKVLDALNYYNTVHFKINGKKVIVEK